MGTISVALDLEPPEPKVNLDWLYKKYRGICWICRKFCPRDKASRDHIQPWSLGGTNHKSNLALAHKSCNSKRGNGYQEIHFKHYDVVDKDIVILEDHGLYYQVWADKRNGGFNIILARKREDLENGYNRRTN